MRVGIRHTDKCGPVLLHNLLLRRMVYLSERTEADDIPPLKVEFTV